MKTPSSESISDPDYGAFSEKIIPEGVGQVALVQEDIKGRLDTGLSQLDARRRSAGSANKALSLLLQGRGLELPDWGGGKLAADPTNEGLAGCLVQARFDVAFEESFDLIPDALKGSAAVGVAPIDVLRQRGRMLEWWHAALAAYAAHPDDRYARQFAAEADLDEIIRDQVLQRTQRLSPAQQEKIAAAAALLHVQRDAARVTRCATCLISRLSMMPDYSARRSCWLVIFRRGCWSGRASLMPRRP